MEQDLEDFEEIILIQYLEFDDIFCLLSCYLGFEYTVAQGGHKVFSVSLNFQFS